MSDMEEYYLTKEEAMKSMEIIQAFNDTAEGKEMYIVHTALMFVIFQMISKTEVTLAEYVRSISETMDGSSVFEEIKALYENTNS